jgi:hypothetical protein
MTFAAIAAVALLSAAQARGEEPTVTAQNHLVGVEVAQARLHEAAQQRDTDLGTLDAFVTSPGGSAAFAALGVDAGRVRSSLATLNDGELQELASRVAALDTDPVAGALTRRQWLWVGAIAAAVIILIVLVS